MAQNMAWAFFLCPWRTSVFWGPGMLSPGSVYTGTNLSWMPLVSSLDCCRSFPAWPPRSLFSPLLPLHWTPSVGTGLTVSLHSRVILEGRVWYNVTECLRTSSYMRQRRGRHLCSWSPLLLCTGPPQVQNSLPAGRSPRKQKPAAGLAQVTALCEDVFSEALSVSVGSLCPCPWITPALRTSLEERIGTSFKRAWPKLKLCFQDDGRIFPWAPKNAETMLGFPKRGL